MTIETIESQGRGRSAILPDRDNLYNRITWRIIPFIFACYIVNQIDRANIAFAKLQFMKDLDLSDAAYGLGAGVFFLGYVLFEVPSNMLLYRIGARKTLVRIMLLWGAVSMGTCLIKSDSQLYIARFLLGVAEAGFFPGVIYYIGLWYPQKRRARIMSAFIIGIPVAGILGSPVSGWIMEAFAGIAGIKGWQWLFIMEGLPAILLGLAAMFFLVDSPEQALWLSDVDKQRVRQDLESEANPSTGKHHHSMRDALREPMIYFAVIVYFAQIMATNAISLWVPTLIKESGVSSLSSVGLWAAVVWTAAVIGIYAVGVSSDARLERRWHVALAMLITAASFTMLPLTSGQPAAVVAVMALAAAGIYAAVAVFWTIPSAFLTGPAAAAGIAFISSLGGIGGFVSPSVIGWTRATTSSLYMGFDAVAVILGASAAVLLLGIPATIFGRRKAGPI